MFLECENPETYLTTHKEVRKKKLEVRQVLLDGEEGASPGRVVEVPTGADGEERMVAASDSALEFIAVC